jgi:hypothetical protein
MIIHHVLKNAKRNQLHLDTQKRLLHVTPTVSLKELDAFLRKYHSYIAEFIWVLSVAGCKVFGLNVDSEQLCDMKCIPA